VPVVSAVELVVTAVVVSMVAYLLHTKEKVIADLPILLVL
jgi:hypothetical protein